MKKKATRILLALLVLWLAPGCTGKKTNQPVSQTLSLVKQGDPVNILYVCSADGYGVISTNIKAVAEDDSIKKSNIFWARQHYRADMVVAGSPQPGQRALKMLVPEIRRQIARALVGKARNNTYELTLVSRAPESLDPAIRYHKVERVRTVPKKRQVLRYNYLRGTNGEEPYIGKTFYTDGVPHAKVTAFDDKTITLSTIVRPDFAMQVPWGTATIKEAADSVIVTVESRVGHLVEQRGVIGRVSDITEKHIIVDYGHPFADLPLQCTVEVLDRQNQAEPATANPAGPSK